MKKLLLTVAILSTMSYYQTTQPMQQANQAFNNAAGLFIQNWMIQHNIADLNTLTPEQLLQMEIAAQNNPHLTMLQNNLMQEIIQALILNQQAANHIINTPNLFEAFKIGFKVFNALQQLTDIQNNTGILGTPEYISTSLRVVIDYIRNTQYSNNFTVINRNYRELLAYLQDNFPNEEWSQPLINFLEQEITQYLAPLDPARMG